ncbi:XRE family transcriptional regulator [Bradyrhizobium sp. CCBAU 51745]|uniref:helix-turn-helix transcriptional regulator n=1 Tax=Bradyrhizobium sp. CCBAU 51745 TaxID=1325099 RepID=UPI002304E407|nr:helix-turn-helix transcriptional regulator [Bradyrhizobium sp. CCBAU 51745]MDA9441046.1 XRE family transcriptional regulator [Bradyrhizobium sp. CCBAU 51745]
MKRADPIAPALSLSAFLRALRERQSPVEFGIAAGPRRRTPGLRREEVAQLCGLSVTWYTWIEQGRDVSVSASALARIARGLRLSPAERAYLFEVAGKRDPERPGHRDHPPGEILACVDAIDGPAYILDRTWSARRWNAQASRLFAGWLDDDGEKNLLRYIFLRPEARSLILDWASRAQRVVAEFRAAVTAYSDDPDIRRLVEELRLASADFERCWDTQGVLTREGGERAFNHPTMGLRRYQQVSLSLAGWPDYRLTMLLPAPSPRDR